MLFARVVRSTEGKIVGGDRVLEVGKTLQLSVEIEPADATNTKVSWESGDTSKIQDNSR